MQSLFKILVVEDFEPFRRFVRSVVQERAELQIVGEASDGLDAVWQAEKLQPDLILLDISLPRMSGIEVARRIRAVAPQAKILFLSMESSFLVVQECLRSGGSGYVQKMSARSDLLPAIDAALRGIRFVSRGLQLLDSEEEEVAPHSHELLFCSDDEVFLDGFSRFITSAIATANPVIVLVTESHRDLLRKRLLANGFDIDAAIQRRLYVSWDVDEALSTFMVNGWPDAFRFSKAVGDLVKSVARGTGEKPCRVMACGECSPRLWAQGELEAAVRLERLFDEVSLIDSVDMLCAYPVLHLSENDQAFKNLCAAHTAIHSQ